MVRITVSQKKEKEQVAAEQETALRGKALTSIPTGGSSRQQALAAKKASDLEKKKGKMPASSTREESDDDSEDEPALPKKAKKSTDHGKMPYADRDREKKPSPKVFLDFLKRGVTWSPTRFGDTELMEEIGIDDDIKPMLGNMHMTTYKTPLGTTPFNLVYGKACHLPVELEYKAMWAVKLLNFDIKSAKEKRMFQLHELDEIRMDAFESSRIYKEKTKGFHDKGILKREFKVGDQVLLFNSRLKLFPGKLKSRWSGPFKIKEVKPYGAIVLWDKNGGEFTVNGQRVKLYMATTLEEDGISVPLSDPTPT
ncbi:hypothetical protein Rs2_29240 [Raphanus sativus]|nr:hypothetical protein Rs2_29240 [Raphanus sativus]